MDKADMRATERCIYAHLLMEHFYAIDDALANCRRVNGQEQYDELFPHWDDLADAFRQSVWKLLKDDEPVLAQMWDRAVYAEFYREKEKEVSNECM